MIPGTGRLLGVDWGSVRIGIAISDETQLIASPLATLSRRAGRRFPLGQFLTIIERERPVGLVVGVPLGDDGMEGDAGTAAREMGRLLAARSELPIDWIDESFSTADAFAHARAAGLSLGARSRPGGTDPRGIDALAAAELLQRWLDRRR